MNIQIEETIGFANAEADYEAELECKASLGYATEAEYWKEYDLINSDKHDMPFWKMKNKKYSLKYIVDGDTIKSIDSIQTIEIYAIDSDSAKMVLKYIMREQNTKSIQILSCEEI